MGVIKVYFHSSFSLERNQKAALENIHLPHLFLLLHLTPHQNVLLLKCIFSLPIQVQKPGVTSHTADRNTSGSFVSSFQRSVCLQLPCFDL